jgi:hypothetical protein
MDNDMGDIRESDQITGFFSELLVGKLIEFGDTNITSFVLDLLIGTAKLPSVLRYPIRNVVLFSARMSYIPSRKLLIAIPTIIAMMVAMTGVLWLRIRYYDVTKLSDLSSSATLRSGHWIWIDVVLLAVMLLVLAMQALIMLSDRFGEFTDLWGAVLLRFDQASSSGNGKSELMRCLGRRAAFELIAKLGF